MGLTEDGVRAVLDVALTGEEDVVSYWDLLVRLWRREEDVVSYWDLLVRLWRYNLTLVVADG